MCSALSLEGSLQNDDVKSGIFATCELVPEAHRQGFCNHKKSTNQTFVKFAGEKTTVFDGVRQARFLTGMHYVSWYCWKTLKSVFLREWVVYLNEQKVTTMKAATVTADELALTHKSMFTNKCDNPAQGVPQRFPITKM